MEQTIAIAAHAKINWTLDVLSRRPDGFHNIASIMQRIKLADWLTISAAATGLTMTITGPEAEGVPNDRNNIVWRAAELLGVSNATISIEKYVPSQAGLGGGSSDCATALIAFNRLFNLNLSPGELTDVGIQLGSDVPFFLQGSTARVEGLGEIVTPIDYVDQIDLVLLKPDVGVSTKEAYFAIDRDPDQGSYDATARWPAGGPSNDFEDVIYTLYPEVFAAAVALKEAGAMGTLLCGSGSTVMGWGGDARTIAQRLRDSGHHRIWLTTTI